MKALKNNGKKKITLDDISRIYKVDDYSTLVSIVMEKIEAGLIEPIRSSGTNGKSPALYNRYRITVPEPDYSHYEEELLYKLHPSLRVDYYLKNLEKYKEDREYILLLNTYISNHKNYLDESLSMNERSFEIWGREKYLQREGGIKLLKNLEISLEKLNIYETTEPLSYYSHHKKTPQNVLILENKDTFYSMRRHLLKGNTTILGLEIGTLIYGKGKGIAKSFKDFTYCVEPYLSHKSNQIFYFGDLDYEGIKIYENLSKVFSDELDIRPFKGAYMCMLKKANIECLPEMKDGQNKNIGNSFLDAFGEENRAEILEILEMNRYIPQEILSIRDF